VLPIQWTLLIPVRNPALIADRLPHLPEHLPRRRVDPSSITGELPMKKMTLLAAAAALSAVVAAPAMAQQMRGPGGYNSDQPRRHNAYDANAFWPGEVAAGVVGGAIGTAGAIAAAPFGGPEYSWRDESYARRNGFVCMPGSWFRGDDGRMHPCQ
jgi:hypothetical protein